MSKEKPRKTRRARARKPNDPKKNQAGFWKIFLLVAAGLVVMSCLGVSIVASLMTPALLKAKQKANRARAANCLRGVGISLILMKGDRKTCSSFDDLIANRYLEELPSERCEDYEFELLPAGKDSNSNYRPNKPMAYARRIGADDDEPYLVLLADATVVEQQPSQFEPVLKKVNGLEGQ